MHFVAELTICYLVYIRNSHHLLSKLLNIRYNLAIFYVLVKCSVLIMVTYPGGQFAVTTKFCKVAPNICGPLVWNLLHVTRPAHRILRWLLDFWKIYASLLLAIGDRGGTVVKVLYYKSEGRWFDSRWCHWNFSLT